MKKEELIDDLIAVFEKYGLNIKRDFFYKVRLLCISALQDTKWICA